MTTGDIRDRLPFVAALAAEAAALAARLRAEGGGVATLKGAQDFVTAADSAVEHFLRERIARDFPGEAVLGEELGTDAGADGAGPLWVLDPIDGTANFARGADRWCVSVGLVVEGRSRLGAIARHAPAEVYAAAEGAGPATLNGAPFRAAATTEFSRATIEVGWSLRTPVPDYVALVGRVMGSGAGLRCGGSGALALAEVAAGRLDGYLELHLNAWDGAAAMALAHAAGCWTNSYESGDWLARGNPIAVGAPALGPRLGELLRA